MKRAIVTGATGFIGSWLAEELIEHNYNVTLIVRDKDKLLKSLQEQCCIVEKQLQDIEPNDLDNCDICYHLAWGGVSSVHKNDLNIQLENVRASLNLLETVSQSGCRRFISTGTVAEYALCDNVMDMADRQTPNDIYGAAKVSAHYFLEVRARQLSQPFIWCVLPSTFGERRNDGNIVTYTIKALLNGEEPIYGDLHQMWDFLYVKDVVRAIRLIGEKGKTDKVYGIGSGEYHTLCEYITRIRDVIDPSLPLGFGKNKDQTSRTFSSCVNNYDLIRDTGFQQLYSFEEGIKRTIDYWRDLKAKNNRRQ